MRSISLVAATLLATAFARGALAGDAGEAAGIAGSWTGTASYRGAELRIAVHFARAGTGWTATLDAPEVLILDRPLAGVTVAGARVRFVAEDPDAPLRFEGKLTGDTISGTLTVPQAANVPMQWRVVRTRPAPRPYRRQPLPIPVRGATLAATLYLPTTADTEPVPGIILLGGSSSNLRSDYAFYADLYARNGFAVVTYDKRGNGASTGDYRTASFDQLVGDAQSVFHTFAALPQVDADRIGIWGISQGAAIAPLVSRDIAFLIGVSSPGVPLAETAAYQDSLRVAWRWGNDFDAGKAAQAHRRIAAILADSGDTARIAVRLDSVLAPLADLPWRQFTALPRESPRGPQLTAWYWAGRLVDPASAWARAVAPTLLVFGEADELVPARASMQRLAAALRDAGRDPADLRVFPRANHVLRTVASPLVPPPAAWDWPRVAPGYLDTLVQWTLAHARPRPASPRSGAY